MILLRINIPATRQALLKSAGSWFSLCANHSALCCKVDCFYSNGFPLPPPQMPYCIPIQLCWVPVCFLLGLPFLDVRFLFGDAMGVGSRGDCFYQARELKQFQGLGPQPVLSTSLGSHLVLPAPDDTQASCRGSILCKEARIRLRLRLILSLSTWHKLNQSTRENLTPASPKY